MHHRSLLNPKDGGEEKAANPHADYQVVASKKEDIIMPRKFGMEVKSVIILQQNKIIYQPLNL